MELPEGERAVKLARRSVENWVRDRQKPEPENEGIFSEDRGVFVSIHTHPDRSLRGCIGFPEPIMPLGKALVNAAVSACHDPRFHSLTREELKSIIIEVSVLTKPEPIKGKPKERRYKIMIGRDGLMVRRRPFSGLLLPQVATEQGFSPEQFLCQCCRKAGLNSNEWLSGECEVMTFQAEIFSEESPNGSVVKK